MMREHTHRWWVILCGFAVSTAASVALFLFDIRDAGHAAAGVGATLALALIDATRVQRRFNGSSREEK